MPTPVPFQDEHDPLTSKPFWVFIVAVFALLLLMFWLPIQDVLTHLLMQLGGARLLQYTTVPYELHVVSTLLTLLGFHIQTGKEYITWQKALGGNEFIYFTWNCGGWQSLLLFLVSAIPGLSGKHTRLSKWETFLMGIVGTYLFTLFRLMAVLMIYIWCGRPLGILFHDYLTIFLTFGYLALFWWFAQRFVLTEHSRSLPAYRTALRFIFGRGILASLLVVVILLNYMTFFVPYSYASSNVPTIEQQLNIFDNTQTAGAINNGIVLIDTANYSSATYYFEVVAKVTSGTGNVDLKYNAGTGAAPSGGSTLSITGITATSYTRYRSSAFTPTGVQNAYVAPSSSGTGLSIQVARIVVVQSTSGTLNNSVTQIEVGNQETTTSTTDTVLANPKYWKYDSTKYDGTVIVYFEATLNNNTASNTTTASLYQSGASCTTQVSGSTVTVTDTTAERARSADISANLTDGTTYMVCFHTSSGTTGRIKNAKIVIQQTSTGGLSKMEIQHLSVNQPVTNATSTYTSENFLFQYNPSDWAGGTFNYYFESTLKTSAGTGYSQLYNTTDSSAVSSSEVTTTNTSDTLVRSSALTMPTSAKDMDTQIKNSATNTTTVEGSWLVVDVMNMGLPSIEQEINIYNGTFTSGLASNGMALINTNGYSGTVNYYFEVDALVTSGTGSVTLTYNAGTVGKPSGGSTVSISTITATTYTRYRSAAFSPTGEQNAYISAMSGTGISVQAARIIIVQTGTAINNTETQIEVGDKESGLSSTTDAVLTAPKYWKYDGSKYDGTVTVYFEASGTNSTTSDTWTASLYVAGSSCTTQVTGSSITSSDNTAQTLKSGDISGNLTSGTTYMVCVHDNAGAVRLKNAKLVVTQTSSGGLSKMELQRLQINQPITSASTSYTAQNFVDYYDPASWAGGTFTYSFGTTMHGNINGSGTVQLYNSTDASAITNSAVTTASVNDTLVVSSAVSFPSAAKELDSQIKSGSAPGSSGTFEGTWWIVDVSSLQTPENLLPLLPFVLFLPSIVRFFNTRRKKQIPG